MGRFERQIAHHLEPGEVLLRTSRLSGSRDIATDIPEPHGLTALLTDRRLLFFGGSKGIDLHWWVWLDQIRSVSTDMRWQKGVINKGRETFFTLDLADGHRFVAATIHVVESKRRIERFLAELTAAVNSAGRDQSDWS